MSWGTHPASKGQGTGPAAATSPCQPHLGDRGNHLQTVFTLFTKINKLGLQPNGGRSGVFSWRGLPIPTGRPDADTRPQPRSLLPQWDPMFMATLDLSSVQQRGSVVTLEPLSPSEQAQDRACSYSLGQQLLLHCHGQGYPYH